MRIETGHKKEWTYPITSIIASHVSLLPRHREALRISLGPHIHKPRPKIVGVFNENVLDVDVQMLVQCLLHLGINEG